MRKTRKDNRTFFWEPPPPPWTYIPAADGTASSRLPGATGPLCTAKDLRGQHVPLGGTTFLTKYPRKGGGVDPRARTLIFTPYLNPYPHKPRDRPTPRGWGGSSLQHLLNITVKIKRINIITEPRGGVDSVAERYFESAENSEAHGRGPSLGWVVNPPL